MLATARVGNILVDHRDAANIPQHRGIQMLDSGAYRAFRAGTRLSLNFYLEKVRELHERCDLIIAPDVVGDARQTLENWQAVKDLPEMKNKLVPVWQWNTPLEHLIFYLQHSEIVGIGGLAKIFHEDADDAAKASREETLENLLHLCEKFPNRFHLFGLNDLNAIGRLAPFAHSADSAFWLTRAGRGLIFFRHSKTEKLTQAPHRRFPQYNRLDRRSRGILNATTLEEFLSR